MKHSVVFLLLGGVIVACNKKSGAADPPGPPPACQSDSDCSFIASDHCCPGFPPAPPYTPVAKGKGGIRDNCRRTASGESVDINCVVAPACIENPEARCVAGKCAVALVKSAGCKDAGGD